MEGDEDKGGGSFRASDLGFFHPDLEESYGVGDIVFNCKEIFHRDVYSFCRRVEDYALSKGEDAVRTNLSFCFRGSFCRHLFNDWNNVNSCLHIQSN